MPNWERLFAVFAALRQGWTVERSTRVSHIDPWFLREIREIVELEAELACWNLGSIPAGAAAARQGDRAHRRPHRAAARPARRRRCAQRRRESGIRRVYKRVDTCAAEFPASTPYLYSTCGAEDEVERRPTGAR